MARRIIKFGNGKLMNIIQLIFWTVFGMLVVVTAVCIAILLSGCSATDDVTGGANGGDRKQGSAIAFSVSGDSTARAATRTAQGTITLTELQAQGFGVFACHTGTHPYVSTSTSSNLMYNQQVTWDDVNSVWEYSPLVYWPVADEDQTNYVSFFAYAPHSENAGGCIADMSRPEDTGDPWILYQLGGDSEDWQDSQVDLVYDFKKDQRRQYPISTKVSMNFKHALATIGDRVTITCSEELQAMLKTLYIGTDVVMTVNTLTVDYLLTSKGRLVLNSNGTPNWQAVESGDQKVHRYLRLTQPQAVARATSASNCLLNDIDTTDVGIFYIPLEVGTDKQKVTVTADYTITTGATQYVVSEGSVSATVDLSFVANASEARNLKITLNVPEIECSGAPLTEATVGQTICEHGRVHTSTTGSLPCNGRKVAVVAYAGSGSGEAGFSHGLALALNDATTSAWCTTTGTACTSIRVDSKADALNLFNGVAITNLLASHATHSHTAAIVARAYVYANDEYISGAHPTGTSQWMLPSMGQWNLMVKDLTGVATGLDTSENAAYRSSAFNSLITAAGGIGLAAENYWSCTESSTNNAWYVNFESGKINSSTKTDLLHVRPAIAF